MTSLLPLILAAHAFFTPAFHSPQEKETLQPEPNTFSPEIYVIGGEVASPRLLAANLKLASADNCKKKKTITGHVGLSFVLDKAGIPRNIGFVGSDNFAFNELADELLAGERFSPALLDSKPVPVSFLARIELTGCEDKNRSEASGLRLTEKPTQTLAPFKLDPEDAKWALAYTDPNAPVEGGKKIFGSDRRDEVQTVPHVLNNVEAVLSEEARNGRFAAGKVTLLGVVDPSGQLRDIRVTNPCGFGLEAKAIEAVRQYRFKPAMKDGQAVAFIIRIDINFRKY